MVEDREQSAWSEFLLFIKKSSSRVEYANWIAPIVCVKETDKEVTLQVPNVFVKEYLLDNYTKTLANFLPSDAKGNLLISFDVKVHNVIKIVLLLISFILFLNHFNK